MRILLLISILFLLKVDSVSAEQTEFSEQTVDLSVLENAVSELTSPYQEYLPGIDIQDVSNLSVSTVTKGVIDYFFHEIILSSNLLGTLILLSLLSALLKVLQSAFEKTAISKVADIIVVSAFMLISLGTFKTVADVFLNTATHVNDLLIALLPVILGLIAASGGVTSAVFFSPVLLFLVNSSIFIIKTITIPLLYISTILGITSQINSEYSFSGLAISFRKIAIWTLGIMMATVIGFLSIQGVTTSVADGVGAKSLTFVTSNFIPVVGRVLTDATGVALNMSVVLKNSIGLAGLVVLLIILLFPALKILAVAAVYKLAEVAFQPLNHKIFLKSVEIVSKNLFAIFAGYMIFAFFIFLALTIIILVGNIPIMVR